MVCGSARAAMGNLGTTYGILPSDLATAQALSMFNTQVSALYYNPAYVTKDPRGELTGGLMHAAPQLKLKELWGDGTVTRTGSNVLEDTPSQQVLLGMKTDLTNLTQYKKPLYFGMILGVEKFGSEMMSFDSQTSQEGQYFEYGREPLFLVMGGGMNLWRGISGGLSTRVTLHSSATLNASSTMAGKTSYEQMQVSAQPKLRPILGLNVDWGKTLCPDAQCWLDGFETALAFRGYSNSMTAVNSNITIPGTVPSPGVALLVNTLDAYQPNTYSVGLLYRQDKHYRVGLTVEMQQWSDLESELKHDTIKDQAVEATVGRLKFRDIIVPRVGGEYQLSQHVMLAGGVAYSPTPLDSNSSLDVNYLDCDKIIAGLGVSLQYDKPPVLAFPVRMDIGYQYQQLLKRDFEFYTSQGTGYSTSNPHHYETVQASGSVNVLSASVTLKF
jgi:hypothetical protein